MSDVVADELERELRIDKPLDTGVAKRVGAWAWDVDPSPVQVVRRSAREAVRRQRGWRGAAAEEHAAVCRGRPALLQVLEHGGPDDRGQGIGRRMARLALGDPESVPLPVDVIQREGGDFPRAQPIRHEQEQDGIVALADGRAPVHRVEHPTDVVPTRSTEGSSTGGRRGGTRH